MLRRALAGPLAALVLACTSVAPTLSPSPTDSPTSVVTPSPTPTPFATPSPTLQATPTPSPTLSPTSTAAPSHAGPSDAPPSTGTKTEPPSAGLGVDPVTIDRHLDAFTEIAADNGGRRTSGTPGYDASVDYVVAELEALGVRVERQPVEFTFFEEVGPVTLEIGDESWGESWLQPMLYSGEGTINGEVETVGVVGGVATQSAGCNASDWVDFEAGKIALVMGGGCFSRDKVTQAQVHGAEAVITLGLSIEEGHALQPTLISPALIEIPAVLAASEPSQALLDAEGAGASVTLSLDVEERAVTVSNVIAEIPGKTDEVVMLGGHLDSVLDGPGINDNASGVSTLLALAERIAAEPAPERTVRFGFWAAEEFGLFGSVSYVNGLSGDEITDIHAYINLDMVASPNAAHYVYNAGAGGVGAQLTDLFIGAFEDLGSEAVGVDLGGGSDHVQFDVVGIPTGGLFSGIAPLTPTEAEAFDGQAEVPADPCYHLGCDDRDNADDRTAVLFADATGLVLKQLIY